MPRRDKSSTRAMDEAHRAAESQVTTSVAEAGACSSARETGSASIEFSGAGDDFFPGTSPVGDPLIGEMLGGVNLERKIGSGGMGTVYAGRQLKTGKLVAVKVVLPEFASPRALARFDFEAQVLGKLDHPGLVRILHADTYTRAGVTRPFFVMEYVAGGRRLDEFAATDQPSERGWMLIFREVCQAVAAAQARGIVHRDLKPGNILIDATGRPRVIDFGVALVRDPSLSGDQPTEDGSLGTPRYMSPEQAAGRSEDLDVTTDVYSLGVVIYERLAGVMPYEIKVSTDAARVINEVEPVPLGIASPRISRDVCTIVMKCLAKERAARYSSAAELAADIDRFLNDEAIVAAPPTLGDSVRRFCRRHRLLATAVVIVAATLLASLGVVTSFYLEADHQRRLAVASDEIANEEREISDNTLEMVVATLGMQPPRTAEEVGSRKRLLLGAAAAAQSEYAGGNTPRQRAIRGGFLTAIGRSLLAIGDPMAAATQLSLAVKALESAESGGDQGAQRRLITALHNLAHAQLESGELRAALGSIRRATAITSSVQGALHADTMKVRSLEAMTRMALGDMAAAADLAGEIVNRLQDQLPAYDPDLAAACSNYGEVLQREGDLDAAERSHRAAERIWAAQSGHRDAREGTSLNNLGEVLRQRGRYEEAESLHRRALEIHRATLPHGHFLISTGLSKLAEVLRVTGRLGEAEAVLDEAVSIRRAAGLAEHPEAALLYWRLGLIHAETGRLEAAVGWIRLCRAIRSRRLGYTHAGTREAEAMEQRLKSRLSATVAAGEKRAR